MVHALHASTPPALQLHCFLVQVAPTLVHIENARHESPDELAMRCEGCPGVRKLFVVVVFDRYRLFNPRGRPVFVTSASAIYKVNDLQSSAVSSPSSSGSNSNSIIVCKWQVR